MTGVRIGLAGDPDGTRSRNGAWAPLYVTLQPGKDNGPADGWTVVVESTDGEGIPYRASRAVRVFDPGKEQGVLVYVRPGSDGSEFTVKLHGADGKLVEDPIRVRRNASGGSREVLGPQDIFYLALGAPLEGLRGALQQAGNVDLDRGTRAFGVIEQVAQLPDRWYGYDAADVVVLTTGSTNFIKNLEADAERRQALVEWVRRGGRLVVSVGDSKDAAGLLQQLGLLDCAIKGSVRRAELKRTADWGGHEGQQEQRPLSDVAIALLEPGPGVHADVLEAPDDRDSKERPIIVEGPCGMGRVLLVAFDLAGERFRGWQGQAAFWKKLHAEMAPPMPESRSRDRIELANELQRSLENFGEIPPISFGWVALFLLAYIVLVGPVDYLLLKKVFKRLEWTWLTFPLVVLIVSVAAYGTAAVLKGNELWTNKIDLVDIDLHEPRQVYGTTWFALFNPKSQALTLGLEPSSPEWSEATNEKRKTQAVNVVPLEGAGRTAPSSAVRFRRPYELDEGGGLRGVPVPVWAARTFTASWRAPAGKQPPVEADLRLTRDRAALAGTVVSHLPMELQGAAAFYRGEWFALGTLLPEQHLEVQTLFERGSSRKLLSEWFKDENIWIPRDPVAVSDVKSRPNVLAAQESFRMMRPLLFYTAAGMSGASNSTLRTLDQGWRFRPLTTIPTPPQLQYRDELVLVGRAPSLTGKAEEITASKASPSRLWVGALPAYRDDRPALEGQLAQETYVRVFIPVHKPK
jgi:hypothetical protein